ncbi:hypothetical protein CU098_000104, partial [Rhizopus stolonifer]
MAKKKTKIVSNRGFATTSSPSKKLENPPPPKQEQVPVEKPQKKEKKSVPTPTQSDSIERLLKKYESLNDHKAQTSLERLTKADPVPEEKIRKFRLGSDLEKTLLQIAKHNKKAQSSEFFLNQNDQGKEKIVSQFDILYRMLIKMGFESQDISLSFESTLSTTIDDHLDWLCLNVPYERMPVGFFDKYFEDEDDQTLTLIHNQSKKQHNLANALAVEQPHQEEAVVLDTSQIIKEEDSEIKSRILKAAENYMEEEVEEDVNEKYAQYKLKLTKLQELLPSENTGKKNKKKDSVQQTKAPLTDAETQETMKSIKKLKDTLSSLEADWDFDKTRAQEVYIKQLEALKEEERQKKIEQKRQKGIEAALEKQLKKQSAHDSDKSDDEDGLFGGMLMNEEEEQAAMATAHQNGTSSSSKNWSIIDFAVPKSYVGRYPKDLLLEYCNKHHLGKQSFDSTNIGSGIWRASLKIRQNSYDNLSMQFELPEGLCCTSRQDAEQLAAFYALFEIDSDSSVYKVLPNPFKDLWNTWFSEKQNRQDGPRLEAERKRLSFLVDLVDKAFTKNDSNNSSTDITIEQNNTSDKVVSRSKESVSKQQKLFGRVQANFKKRLQNEDYLAMKSKRQDLPISAYRDQVLELIQKNQVLIISGETGCGKSTQVPQFLAEHLLLDSQTAGSIICTQPRRISAMSIANRVSTEMGDPFKSTGSRDSMVGYQIRLESKMSPENVLLFCTTGILLRRLESDKHLDGVSHIVVDEVHERTMESDFLLIILKNLCAVRTDLKIILMSATVEANRFSSYFGNCPVISVPGRTFPVHVQYLEDVIEDIDYVIEEDSPYAIKRDKIKTEQGTLNVSGLYGSTKRIYYEMFEQDSDDDDPYDPARIESKLTVNSEKTNDTEDEDNTNVNRYSRRTRKTLKRLNENKINYDLILELLDHIYSKQKIPSEDESKNRKSEKKETKEEDEQKAKKNKGFKIPETGAILIFLPGMNEIRKLYDIVSSHHIFGDPKKFLLIALHSTLSSENQEKAFEIPPEGVRKIVFSTNIAETGVTISDVTIVIDTGMARVVSYDEKKRVTRLLQKYVAKANARQRRGRAGRVQEGVCFHLFSKQKFEQMPDFELPEILRLPLQELCLRIKVCDLGSIRHVLSDALDPPSDKMIENALLSLQEVQALAIDNGKEVLTPLGSHLSNLPVDVHMGKMIIYGALFRCLDPILTIAAALSFKSPFIRPFGREDEADIARARFQVGNSDFLTIYKAYYVWREYLTDLRSDKLLSNSSIRRKMTSFCKENFLSEQNLEMIEGMKRQYLGLLISIGFVKPNDGDEFKSNPYEVKHSGIQLCQVPNLYNMHGFSVPVINAALTAGLYPKIAEYSKQTKQMVHKNIELQIHPSSMLFHKEHLFRSEFLIYNTVVMNNSNTYAKDMVYMWEASTIDPAAIVLLSTNIDIKHYQRRMVLDDWLYFDCFARTAVLLKFLREELV